MDNEKLKQFLLPIMILVLTFAGLIYFAPKVIEQYQGYNSVKMEKDAKQQNVEQLKAKVEQAQRRVQAEKNKEKVTKESGKPFYKPVMQGLDTEAVIAGEFAEILQLVRANKIKVRSINYDYDPKDDSFVNNAASEYNVARLNMEMIASYTNYDNFLKELYKHEHFLDIQSVEIVPYKKNKRILLINFKVKLYAKK